MPRWLKYYKINKYFLTFSPDMYAEWLDVLPMLLYFQTIPFETNYLKIYWTDLHQIFS